MENVHTLNISAHNFIKQSLLDMKAQIVYPKTIVCDINTLPHEQVIQANKRTSELDKYKTIEIASSILSDLNEIK